MAGYGNMPVSIVRERGTYPELVNIGDRLGEAVARRSSQGRLYTMKLRSRSPSGATYRRCHLGKRDTLAEMNRGPWGRGGEGAVVSLTSLDVLW
jgi:hypothetical protein